MGKYNNWPVIYYDIISSTVAVISLKALTLHSISQFYESKVSRLAVSVELILCS